VGRIEQRWVSDAGTLLALSRAISQNGWRGSALQATSAGARGRRRWERL